MRAVILGAFLALLVVIGITDSKTKRIPDRYIKMILIIDLLAVGIFENPAMEERIMGLLICGIGLWILTILTKGAFGGGDIKLMAAAGAFLGWKAGMVAVCGAFFLAGGYCIIGLILGQLSRRSRIAFGPFLCWGCAAAVVISSDLINKIIN